VATLWARHTGVAGIPTAQVHRPCVQPVRKFAPGSFGHSLTEAHLDTTTMSEAPHSLSPLGTSGERAGEKGTFHWTGGSFVKPLSLSPLLRREERGSTTGVVVVSSNSSGSRAWKGAVTPESSAHNEGKTHTSQRGRAATKGARLCPQDQPQRAGTAQRVGVKQESLAVPTRCGWCSAHSRAPKNRRSSRRFPRILIEVVRTHRSSRVLLGRCARLTEEPGILLAAGLGRVSRSFHILCNLSTAWL